MRVLFIPSLVAGALLALAACQPQTIPMTPDESQRVASFTEHMTPRCVGRYLIDLPEKFILNSQSSAEVDEVKIEARPLAKWQFDDELAGRKMRLERERLHGSDTLSLMDVRQLPGGTGLVFNRSQDGGSAALRTWELLAWRDGFRFELLVDAYDKSQAKRQRPELNSDLDERLAQLMSVYSRLRGRSEGEIPSEPGFCIPHGFVAGPPSEEERAYVAFHLENTPDVYFHVSAMPESLKEERRLLQRSAQIEREMKPSGTQTIRKGEVKYGGRVFEEWLMKGPTPDRVPGTMFAAHGNEAAPGAENPFTRVELFNGFRIPARQRTAEESAQLKDLTRATLSEAEAVAIWDEVLPTLRLRTAAGQVPSGG